MTTDKKIEDAELREMIRHWHGRVESGSIAEAKDAADAFDRVLPAGLPHRGKGAADFTPRTTMEWYAGEFVDIVRNESWFAMNSWMNCIDKFCP